LIKLNAKRIIVTACPIFVLLPGGDYMSDIRPAGPVTAA